MTETETETDRDRDRDRQTETDRQTKTERQKQRDRNRDTETQRRTETDRDKARGRDRGRRSRDTDRNRDRDTSGIETAEDMERLRGIETETERETVTVIEIQTDRGKGKIDRGKTNNIESIQRRAARFVRGDYSRTSSVSSITRELGWASLQSRRTVHDLTLFYKIHSGAVIIQFPPELVSTVRRTRASQQHNRTFIHPCTSVDFYKYSFFVRTVPYWNSLPPSVINANSTTSFFSQFSNIYCH